MENYVKESIILMMLFCKVNFKIIYYMEEVELSLKMELLMKVDLKEEYEVDMEN